MRALNTRFGRKSTNSFGLFFIVISSILFWFVVDIRSDGKMQIILLIASILLGIGTSTTNICSFALTSDLIGLNTECGAFVYGIMSFTDKLANGIVIALIQQFNPCTIGASTITCASYYREVMTFIPIIVSLLTIGVTATMWKNRFGTSRHESIGGSSSQSYGT